jgi:signal transduction histidine kinase
VAQVLDLLVENAVKFTPAGTPIALRVSGHVEDGRTWARIDVADHGPGIDPDDLARLFQPFRQADGSATRAVGGLGMGLATARRIADRMNALLVASSDPGSGTTFSLLLPRR